MYYNMNKKYYANSIFANINNEMFKKIQYLILLFKLIFYNEWIFCK